MTGKKKKMDKGKLNRNTKNNESIQIKTNSISLFENIFGFNFNDIKTYENVCRLAYRPTDPSSIGVMRAFFGILMFFDVPEERGLAEADLRWGDSNACRFPLFEFLKPLSLQWMCMVYLGLWIGSLGIALGYRFKQSALLYVCCYWYLLLLDKSYWNNHSYLFGLISLLLLFSQANKYWSLDAYFGRIEKNTHIPLWNYAILRFQFFILYFIAGLKKLDNDWIEGYSMSRLHTHWLFQPFKFVLTSEQVGYYIIHLNGFFLDLTVGFWLFFDKTRPIAFLYCGLFHLMNSRIFSIGMFPYVCLITMPLFCHFNWPKRIGLFTNDSPNNTEKCFYIKDNKNNSKPITWKHKTVVGLLLSHCALQGFLPYSHFITKGYNNWTNGLYGYSWDMMVHSWDTILVVIKVVDHETGEEHFLDPEAWVQNDRWSKHGDMIYQYGKCIKRNLNLAKENNNLDNYVSNDISIHVDVWSSLNGRFQQRMFNPQVNILNVTWSPWQKVSWLMPLLSDFSHWRQRISDIEQHVYSWSNQSDVLFVADFPGLTLENYINPELTNITLTVLEGEVILEVSKSNVTLKRDSSVVILPGVFHNVHTVSLTPSCYMYSFVNKTKDDFDILKENSMKSNNILSKNIFYKFWKEIIFRYENIMNSIRLISNAFLNILYSVPMVKRVRIE